MTTKQLDIENLIKDFYKNLTTPNPIKQEFEDSLKYFLEIHNFHHCDENKYLFCNIHNHFKEGHNCVACNLQDSNNRIEHFLLGYKLFHDNDIHSIMTNFILVLYLQVECIFEYLNYLQLPEPYRLKHFQTFYIVKRWANFLKHPKAFMLVHHPKWEYEKRESTNLQSTDLVIDTLFVKKYYCGDSLNKELSKTLSNKSDLLVLFPNPFNLIKDFCNEQQKFVNLLKDNKIFRDILDDTATIKDYYNNLDNEN